MGDQCVSEDGFVSAADSLSWTEVNSSFSGQGSHTQNLGNILTIYDPSTVNLGQQIGEGGQGCIFEAEFHTPYSFKPLRVVVKKFKPFIGVSQGHFPIEIYTSKFYSVCRPIGAVFEGDSLCVLMYKFSCDLRAEINSRMQALQDENLGAYDGMPFSEASAILIMMQLAVALKALHECGIYHRDLKAANILVKRVRNKKDITSPTFEVVIADFERSEGVVGTGFYRAPEVLQSLITQEPLSTEEWLAADVYSFGMIFYEVLTGKIPFDGHQFSDYNLVLNGTRPELPDHVPLHLIDIILRCWNANPSSRPSWTDIIQVLQGSDDHEVHNLIDNMENLENSVESISRELKQLIQDDMHLHESDAQDFGTSFFWAFEFVATLEKYVSKFDRESHLQEETLVCTWPKLIERKELIALLNHQVLGYTFTYYGSSVSQECEFIFEFDFFKHAQEIVSLMVKALLTISQEQRHFQCGAGFDAQMNWIDKVFYCHAFIKWQLWSEAVVRITKTPNQELFPPFWNPRNGVQDLFLFVYLKIVTLVYTYAYVLALFVFEPIFLCLQYGLHRMKGCNKFLYPSFAYRICRLQRAWMNYTRCKPLALAMLFGLLYLFLSYRWKGILAWFLFPCMYRFSPHWRQFVINYDDL
ncbi:hypothetical protein KC19_5G124000 [Ceratodon purpureus]|uniref:Protein kinase domain-containing protein n=1 Tax=Ceratodon purpureus TaxID=3225 RepID=A0A8T0I246_CERPU|nr:hypothetical protein KC19_5G124000 [Ceratodon purpureus]